MLRSAAIVTFFLTWAGRVGAIQVKDVPDMDLYPVPDIDVLPAALPAAPEAPTRPGCYVWTPSGCPKRKFREAQFTWKSDVYPRAGSSQEVCEVDRRESYNKWCGVKNALTIFVPPKDKPHRQAQVVDHVDNRAKVLPPDGPEDPTFPGCHVWMPSGCPGHRTFPARYDWQLDRRDGSEDAHTHPAACRIDRKKDYNSWCGTTDAVTIFVPGWTPALEETLPAEPTYPESLPEESSVPAPGEPTDRESLPEESAPAPEELPAPEEPIVSEIFPEESAAASAEPTSPGCYMRFPSGCPKRSAFQNHIWQRDTWGEEHQAADSNEDVCMGRKSSFDSWCGVTDVEVIFKGEDGRQASQRAPPALTASTSASRPEKPTRPGCYVWVPSGCPNQHFLAKYNWKLDTSTQPTNQELCDSRKNSFDSWCGVTDAQTLFVPKEGSPNTIYSESAPNSKQAESTHSPVATKSGLSPIAPASPVEPGCFVWMPTGCTQQQTFRAKLHWRRDEYGEEMADAATSSTACYLRKDAFDRWCGTTDAMMIFVAGEIPPEPEEEGMEDESLTEPDVKVMEEESPSESEMEGMKDESPTEPDAMEMEEETPEVEEIPEEPDVVETEEEEIPEEPEVAEMEEVPTEVTEPELEEIPE